MGDIIYIPYYSLSPSSLTLFEKADINYHSERQKLTFENLNDNENKYFELSEHSRKRLKKSIDFLLYITKSKSLTGSVLKSKSLNTEIEKETGVKHTKSINYKLTFITLTLSAKQHNTDEEIKSKLLHQFLVQARKKWKMEYYIWKAEKQENGNIHFHILTNIFIKLLDLRNTWNKIQNKSDFNYVNLYSNNMQYFFKDGFRPFSNDKRSIETQRKAYESNKKINWTSPNSTDIHSLYKIKNISAYMTKYLAKSVTKTERVQKMIQLYNELEPLQNQYSLNQTYKVFDPHFDFIQYDLQKQIQEIQTKIEELKKQGVSGRIWGQSQNLSKLKSFIDCEHWENIPDIKIVEKQHEYRSDIQCGSKAISTFKFNINHTPKLKEILDKHIETCLSKETPTFFD